MIRRNVLSRSIRATLSPGVAKPMAIALAIVVSSSTSLAGLAQAQAAAQAPATEANVAETMVIVGSRFRGRIVEEAPTPIDLISGLELARGGQIQLQQILKVLVPSFSMSAPATSGSLDFTSTPSLRGLGPGELLLLVNGKRRHSTGILNTFNQIGRGDVTYDFSAIPTAAIGQVEVLRDGASAQYGADAIAGVINLVLDRSVGASANVMSGVTSEGDGRVFEANGSVGVKLGDDGVLRASARFQDRKLSNRALPDTRQQYFGSNGTRTISGNYGSGIGLTPSNGTLDPREATIDRNLFWLGEAPFTSKSVFVNTDNPFGDAFKLYAFGGYSQVDGDSYGFFRRAGQDETVRALYPNG
jgi:iron complex outermembrane receptor protein